MNAPALEAKQLWRTYQRGSETIHALAAFNLTLPSGEMVGIVGRSGSGFGAVVDGPARWCSWPR